MLKWRKEFKRKPKRVVIKLGSLCVSSNSGGIDSKKVKEVCGQISQLLNSNIELVLVCSGAIAAANTYTKSPKPSITDLQAMSSIGQPVLMAEFNKHLAKHGVALAQLLVTHDDIKDSTRRFNLKNTIEKLILWKTLPILNENDSISFDEITLGDNDQLAAMITETISADLLLILSETPGLYSKNPKLPDANLIERIPFDDDFRRIQTIDKNIVGRGGMKTKLDAVRRLTPLAIPVIITSPVNAIASLETTAGSFFEAAPKTQGSKKAKILNQVRSSCDVSIDTGAAAALLSNKSLLPVGIKSFQGRFVRGDVVKITSKGRVLGFGVAEFGSSLLRKYLSKNKPDDYQISLGVPSKVFVHKNNLVIKEH